MIKLLKEDKQDKMASLGKAIYDLNKTRDYYLYERTSAEPGTEEYDTFIKNKDFDVLWRFIEKTEDLVEI